MDNKLTERIQQWLQLEQPTVADITDGAQMLLRIDRNRVLFQNIMRRPQSLLPKLRHELQKHLRYRLDGLTLDGVRLLNRQVTAIMETPPTPPMGGGTESGSRHGRRKDHEQLPPEIQALWDTNAERWKRMKEAFATCQTLEQPCDRYEYLRLISDTYTKYRMDMDAYDSYDTNNPDMHKKLSREQQDIENARSYLYKQLSRLDSSDADQMPSDDLRQRMQQRIDTIKAANATIADELQARLQAYGLKA